MLEAPSVSWALGYSVPLRGCYLCVWVLTIFPPEYFPSYFTPCHTICVLRYTAVFSVPSCDIGTYMPIINIINETDIISFTNVFFNMLLNSIPVNRTLKAHVRLIADLKFEGSPPKFFSLNEQQEITVSELTI